MANLIIKPTSGGSLILQDEGGTAANTISATGNTTLAGTANNLGTVTAGAINGGSIGSAVTGFAGIKEADQWRLTTDYSGANGDLTANFERNDNGFGLLGTGMTQSSGIFTFPSTGIWWIKHIGSWRSSSSDQDYMGVSMSYSSNSGSSWTTIALNYASAYTTGHYSTSASEAILDVTNVSTYRLKFSVDRQSGNFVMHGNGTTQYGGFTFIRLGDT